MAASKLRIDLSAIRSNWSKLDSLTSPACETAAVVKAKAYGLGADKVLPSLSRAGCNTFFVALAEEGREARKLLPGNAEIFVLSGHMEGDADMLAKERLAPILNSAVQVNRHLDLLPGHPFGLQFETGMNRLGMISGEFASIRDRAIASNPVLAMSHLACADEPGHPLNSRQLAEFKSATADLGLRRSLAATGGILLGAEFHFDLCRPGIGLFGGHPYVGADPVVHLDLPVIQVRELSPGETVGYGADWSAEAPARIATVSGGYADGILRSAGKRCRLFSDGRAFNLAGRVSMDLLTVDVSNLNEAPSEFQLLGNHQSIDDLADAAGTIGYEILTSLGSRYQRTYSGEMGS